MDEVQPEPVNKLVPLTITTTMPKNYIACDRFLLLEKLGKGGFGLIYSGVDLATGIRVAVKLVCSIFFFFFSSCSLPHLRILLVFWFFSFSCFLFLCFFSCFSSFSPFFFLFCFYSFFFTFFFLSFSRSFFSSYLFPFSFSHSFLFTFFFLKGRHDQSTKRISKVRI